MIRGVLKEEIAERWEDLERLIEKPLHRLGLDRYWSPDDVLHNCVAERWQCWVIGDFEIVVITFIESYPTGTRRFVIHLVGGVGLEEWRKANYVLEQYAKHHGCTEIVGQGRSGWVRLLRNKRGLRSELSFSYEV